MKQQTEKKKGAWWQHISILFFLAIGGFCGFFIGKMVGQDLAGDRPIWKTLLMALGLLLWVYAALIIHIILHEAGHLCFGLMSGYQFSSFRIFSLMWIKENDSIKFRRLAVAGTGGQCLMTPPDMVNGKIPVTLYNLGGSIMNLIVAVICFILYFVFAHIPFVSTVLLFFAVIGLIIAVMNGIPMRTGTVDNDGYNAFALTRSSDAMHAFWIQMKVNEQLAQGMRLKNMPNEWFAVPSDEAMKNSMVAAVGVFVCNRLMDAKQFEQAESLMSHMMEIESGMVGLHRSLMICDRMYIEMITKGQSEMLDGMLTKEQKAFMKQMKSFPTVLRTEYVYALLCEKDIAKAQKIKEQFEKCAKNYPYQCDVQSERELIEIAEAKSNHISF